MLIRHRSPSVASRVAVTRQSAVSQRGSELLDHPEIGRYLAFRKGLPQFTDQSSQVVHVVFRRRKRQLHVLLEDRGVHRPVPHEAVQVCRGQNTGRCLPPPQRDPVHLRFEGDLDRDVAQWPGPAREAHPRVIVGLRYPGTRARVHLPFLYPYPALAAGAVPSAARVDVDPGPHGRIEERLVAFRGEHPVSGQKPHLIHVSHSCPRSRQFTMVDHFLQSILPALIGVTSHFLRRIAPPKPLFLLTKRPEGQ